VGESPGKYEEEGQTHGRGSVSSKSIGGGISMKASVGLKDLITVLVIVP
jgi:hypothetical protein